MTPIISLGGGHDLFVALRTNRQAAGHVIAVVTVIGGGGSSGRLCRELRQISLKGLHVALVAFSTDVEKGDLWEKTLQHRFGGIGTPAGYVIGNLTIASLTSVMGNEVDVLDEIGRLLQIQGRVMFMPPILSEIETEVVGLEQGACVMRQVRGQVAVVTTPDQMRRARLIFETPLAFEGAAEAIPNVDLVTLGPDSWFISILPYLQVSGLRDALQEIETIIVMVLNLATEPGETVGFSSEQHIHILTQHVLNSKPSYVLVDDNTPLADIEREYLQRAAGSLGTKIVSADA